MKYDYMCDKCDIVWTESHGMNEEPVIKCPKCGSHKTHKTWLEAPIFYVRGDGYLDKKGVQRDMNLYKLTKDDPYKKYRERGEKDDLAIRLKKAGQHNPKRKHYMAPVPKTSIPKSKT